jgi:hypothetical protein
MTKQAPSGWTVVGTMIVTIRAGHAVSAELKDASGRLVESAPLAKERDLLSKACTLGGVLAVMGRAPADEDLWPLTVYKPSAQEPSADVVRLCTKPAELNVDAHGGVAWAFVRDAYEEQLTSPRWRKWLFDLDEELHHGQAAAQRAKREKGDELETAARAAGMGDKCWMLRFL